MQANVVAAILCRKYFFLLSPSPVEQAQYLPWTLQSCSQSNAEVGRILIYLAPPPHP